MDHLIHQPLVTIVLRLTMSSDSITEIVRFINDDQIIVAPVQAIQIKAVRLSAASGQVCMEQDIIIQPIRCNRVVHIVVFVGIPVLCQLFWTQHQNRLVSVLHNTLRQPVR